MKKNILVAIAATMLLSGCASIPQEALIPRLAPIVYSAQGVARETAEVLKEDTIVIEEDLIPETGTLWTTSSLNMRTGPGVMNKALGSVPKNTLVSSLGKTKNGWYKISFGGKTGYVSGKYLTSKAPVVASSPKAAVVNSTSLAATSGSMWTTASLNMRKGTGTDYGVIKSIPRGAKVELHAKSSNGWYEISYDGKKGFVSGKYLTNSEPKQAAAPTSTKTSGYQAMKLYLPDRTLTYKNGGKSKGQSIIDGNIKLVSTWGGAETFSGSDGMNTHFIGHSHGAFKGIGNYSIGQTFVVTDANGTPFTYKITRKFVVDDDANGVNDGKSYYNDIVSTSGGEIVTLQTCKTSTTNWIFQAEKVN